MMAVGVKFAGRLFVNVIMVIATMAAAALAWRSLFMFVKTAPLRDLAMSIETGAHPDSAYLLTFIRNQGLDRPDSDCADSLTRAELTVALAALTTSAREKNNESVTTSANVALRVVEHRLACSPLDGNAWLRYATILSALGQPSTKVITALRLSYALAPNESWIIEPRILFATFMYVRGEKTFEAQYRRDLELFSTFMPTRAVAAKYVNSPPAVRTFLHSAILDQPDERQKAIIGEIDNLGVVFAPK
jgi:hypothetical protein